MQVPSRAKRVISALGLEPAARTARGFLERPTARRAHSDDDILRAALAYVLRSDDNCVDVGAHGGNILSAIVRLAPEGRHLAFEPIPDLAEQLRRRFPRVAVHNAAVAEESGQTTFEWVKTRPAVSSIRADPRVTEGQQVETIQVPLVRLDDVVTDSVAFIKIDVEGAEEGVLAGATETLARHRPLVVFEHGLSASVYGTSSGRIYDLLSAAMLRVFSVSGEGPYSREQFVEVVQSGDVWNFAAH
jgi:FkbM family methyltransferase